MNGIHVFLSQILVKNGKKERPISSSSRNLLFLVYNVQGLNTHVADMDILLNNYRPHVCVLTGVGTAAKNLPSFSGYKGIAQTGTNSYGGVAILYENSLTCKVVERETNFLLLEVQTSGEPIHIGAIYVPPKSLPPFHLFARCNTKTFFIFGDYNAKHSSWNCLKNNTSGIELYNWLEYTGYEMIAPSKSTSRRSNAVIDFGVTQNANGWTSEVLEDGTSGHWPILFQSPICANKINFFRKTNWKIFTYFLTLVYEYWNSLVYNLDTDSFFEIFSLFLSSLWDRCSQYEKIEKYRPPWPISLVMLARAVNKCRRTYRRTRAPSHLDRFLLMKNIFWAERSSHLQRKREEKLIWLNEGQNIWKYVKPVFHSFSPPFHGLTTVNKIKEKDPKMVVEMLAEHYEKHFSMPLYNSRNPTHVQAVNTYENIGREPYYPLEQIRFEEVLMEWKRFQPKKSTDSVSISAFLLKKLPMSYIAIVTILFNRCAENGCFFNAAKHAKVVCLSKEGLFPTVDKLRPISLLPNIGKWFERIIHRRLLAWCNDNNIYIDEQSGFTAGRRLQTRILSLVEDLRLTIAACNRPALVLFIDFLSAFDKMYYPTLIYNLKNLNMPSPLLKWIYNWLQNRSLAIHFGEEVSRNIPMYVGAPQGSVLAATLFRLHVHLLPSCFCAYVSHMFADDLAIQISGDLEKTLVSKYNRN